MPVARTKQNLRDDLAQAVRAAAGLCLLLAIVVTALILAQDPQERLIQSASVFKDRSGQMQFDAVRAQSFTETGPSVAIGFEKAVHWLRLVIAPDPAGADVLVRLRPVILDHATIFLPAADGRWVTAEAGELVDAEAQSWPSVFRQSLLVPASDEPVTVYLRIATKTVSTAFVTAYSPQLALQIEIRTLVFHMLIFGLKLASILLVLLTLPKRRSPINLVFLCLEAGLIVHLLVSLGYARAIFHDLPVAVLDFASGLSVAVMIALGSLFHSILLGQYDPADWTRKAGVVPVVLGVLGVAGVLVGERQLGLLLSSASFLSAMLVIVTMLATVRNEAAPGRKVLWLVYGLYLPVMLLNFLTTVGLVRIDWFYRNVVELSALTNSTLLLMLVLLMNLALNAQWEDERRGIRKIILVNRSEMQRRRGQQSLTHIVATETRAALGRLHLLTQQRDGRQMSPELARALSGLDDVITDCLQADEAETGKWQTEAKPFDLAALFRLLIAQQGDAERIALSMPEPLVLVSDQGLVSVLLRHLLVNASEYAVAGSMIAVTARQIWHDGTPTVSIEVANRVPDGYDFDPVLAFEKFYRGAASSPTSGTGLGLFICREITGVLGGEIGAHHDGTTVLFRISLPDRT